MASAEDGTSKLDLDKTPMDERRRFTVEVTMLNRHAFRSFFGPEFANKCGHFTDHHMSTKISQFGYWVDYPNLGFFTPVLKPGKPIIQTALSNGGYYLYASLEDKSIKMWNLVTKDTEDITLAHDESVDFLAYDSGLLVSCSSKEKKIKVWNQCDKHQLLHTLPGTAYAIGTLKSSSLSSSKMKSTNIMIVGIEESDIRIWSAISGECLKSFAADSRSPIRDGLLLDNLLVCISGEKYQSLEVWDPCNGKEKKKETHDTIDDEFKGMTLNCDRNKIAFWYSGSEGMMIYHWPEMERMMWVTQVVHCADFHPSIPYLIAVGENPDYMDSSDDSDTYLVKLYNIHSGHWRHSYGGHKKRVHQMKFTPDGTRLITCSLDQTIRVWNVEAAME